MSKTRLTFAIALILGAATVVYAQWRQAIQAGLAVVAVQPAAGVGLYNKTLTLTGGTDTFETTSTVLDFIIMVDPSAAANVTVTSGGTSGTWWPGFAMAYRGADIASFSFVGTSGDKITIAAQTPAVR